MTSSTTFSLQVDKFGRVVIPKKVREALNLRAGSTLQADLRDGELHLRGEQPRYRIEQSAQGRPRLVLPPDARVSNDPVSETPDERIDTLMKW